MKERAFELMNHPERKSELDDICIQVEEKYEFMRSLTEEKQNLIVTSIYLYENAVRKVD